jgi:5'-nucleotidase
MRIVVDMDGVLCDFASNILRHWNSSHGTQFTPDDIKTWDMKTLLGQDSDPWITKTMSKPEFFRELKALPGAIDGLLKLQTAGHQVKIVTHVSKGVYNAYDGKRAWIEENIPWFDPHDICFYTRKEEIDGEMIIDDAPHNILNWLKVRGHAIVMDSPWNKDLGYLPNDRPYTRLYRAYTWRDVLHFVEEVDYQRYKASTNRG